MEYQINTYLNYLHKSSLIPLQKTIKKLSAIIFACLVLAGCGGGDSDESEPKKPVASPCGFPIGDMNCKTITLSQYGERHYFLYEPTGSGATKPILVLFHGAPGSPSTVENFFDAKQFAEDNNFILAIPLGDGNFAWPSKVTSNTNKSSATILTESIIEELTNSYNGNSDRVYVAGFSAGGFMVYQLACQIPERITGAIAISGQLRGEIEHCNPSSPIALHHIHGTQDLDVPAAGRSDGIISVANTLEKFAAVNNCDPDPNVSAEFEFTVDKKIARTFIYQQCARPLKFTEVDSSVHEEIYQSNKLHQLMMEQFSQ